MVPNAYRKHLTAICSRYRRDIHDVLCVCGICHVQYEKHSKKLRQTIAEEFGIPLSGMGFVDVNSVEFISQKKKQKLNNLARALINHADVIPASRQQTIKEKISSIIGHQPSESEIQILGKIKLKLDNRGNDYKSHGKLVVLKLTSTNTIERFIQRWRRHFINSMNPQFLPKHWKIKKRAIKTLLPELSTNECTDEERHQ